MRLLLSTARLESCLATIAGWRIGSFTTEVVMRIFVVTAATAAIAMNTSRKGTPSRKSRLPSSL